MDHLKHAVGVLDKFTIYLIVLVNIVSIKTGVIDFSPRIGYVHLIYRRYFTQQRMADIKRVSRPKELVAIDTYKAASHSHGTV